MTLFLMQGGELHVLEASSEEATVFFRGWYRSMLQVDFSYCRSVSDVLLHASAALF